MSCRPACWAQLFPRPRACCRDHKSSTSRCWRRSTARVELAELAGKGDVCGDERATVSWALDPEPALEDAEPVRQGEETAAVGPRASGAVVARLDPEGAVLDARPHR